MWQVFNPKFKKRKCINIIYSVQTQIPVTQSKQNTRYNNTNTWYLRIFHSNKRYAFNFFKFGSFVTPKSLILTTYTCSVAMECNLLLSNTLSFVEVLGFNILCVSLKKNISDNGY